MTRSPVLLALLLLASPAAASPAAPVRLPRAEADSLRAAIRKDRKETEDSLRVGRSSYFATILRRDFGSQTTLRVGRAKDNDVVLDDPGVALHHLSVRVDGDSFHVSAAPDGAPFTVRGRETRSAVVGPAAVGVGRFTLRLSHQRYPAIIVFDPRSPRYRLFHGLEYFPVDFRYRYLVEFTPNPKPDTTIILSTRGNRRRAVRAGWFEFLVDGVPCRLAATRLLEPGVGENDLSVFFRDATTGRQSYPVGRYVEPEKQKDGRYLLDFNVCYNPACAFSDHYNCPIPPAENRLKVAIRAGEMDSHYH